MLKDLVAALTLLSIAGIYYALAADINRSALEDEVGAAGLPIVYATVLALLGGALAAKALAAWWLSRRGLGSVRAERSGAGTRWLRSAGMLAIGIGYVAVAPYFGYLLSIALVVGLAAWYQGEPANLRLAAAALAGGILYYVIFGIVLGVDVPAGLWPSLWGA